MFEFIKSNSIKVDVLQNQIKHISSKQKINEALSRDGVIGFDILMNKQTMGFAMLRQYDKNKYFLWNYAIDKQFQGKGFGKQALKELILFLQHNYCCEEITTTYKMGNDTAKKLYEKLGFKEIEEVYDEQEVDMMLKL